MTPSNQSNSSKPRQYQLVRFIGVLVAFALLFLLGFTVVQLLRLRSAVSNGDAVAAARAARLLVPIGHGIAPKVFGDTYVLAPLRILPELAVSGSEVISQLPELAKQQASGTMDFNLIRPKLAEMETSLSSLETNFAAHPNTKNILEKIRPGVVEQLGVLRAGIGVTNLTLRTTGKMLIMLQNTDELRATGGFMGSYVLLTLQDGVLTEWVVEDIYDADGQFTGFIEAPPGAKEYLSSNRGLRLPDANWSPDFPTSAQHILQFFALSERSYITTVAAVNLTLAEQLLKVLGPIELPDYETPITADNIATELRSQRDGFFAGSIRKKHLLAQLLVQVQLRLSQVSLQQQLALAQIVHEAVSRKDVQMYAVDPQVQAHLELLSVTGQIVADPHTNPVLLTESNVGINKANRGVSRAVSIDKNNQTLNVTLELTNTNLPPKNQQQEAAAAPHNGYINFQRLFVRPEWQLTTVTVDNIPQEIASARTIKTFKDIELTEYGLLVRVPEKRSVTLHFSLHTNDTEVAKQPVVFIPQAGIPAERVQVLLQNE